MFVTPGLQAVGDDARVRQILRNLLTNAVRYGGPNVAIEAIPDGDGVAITVTDDGDGVPEEAWERIFEPYQRGHETPGLPGSVGIGLAISRQLASLMGGDLTYRFEDGLSLFRLTLRGAA
jgi:signal transduction histidine kinase